MKRKRPFLKVSILYLNANLLELFPAFPLVKFNPPMEISAESFSFTMQWSYTGNGREGTVPDCQTDPSNVSKSRHCHVAKLNMIRYLDYDQKGYFRLVAIVCNCATIIFHNRTVSSSNTGQGIEINEANNLLWRPQKIPHQWWTLLLKTTAYWPPWSTKRRSNDNCSGKRFESRSGFEGRSKDSLRRLSEHDPEVNRVGLQIIVAKKHNYHLAYMVGTSINNVAYMVGTSINNVAYIGTQ